MGRGPFTFGVHLEAGQTKIAVPSHAVHIVRLSLVYLVVGSTLGAIMLLDRAFQVAEFIWWTRPFHIELLFFGWFVHLAFGVASWILPRTAGAPGVRVLAAAVIVLNMGIFAVGAGQMLAMDGLTFVGRLAEMLGVIVFAVYIWPRIRGIREVSLPDGAGGSDGP